MSSPAKIKKLLAEIKEIKEELDLLRPIPDAYLEIRAGTHMEFEQRRNLAKLVGKYIDWWEKQEEKRKNKCP